MTIADLKEILEVKRQVFLTGAGGTGKTYTLKALLPHFKKTIKISLDKCRSDTDRRKHGAFGVFLRDCHNER